MNLLVTFFTVFLFLLPITLAEINVELISTTPFPATPGATLLLQFVVENTGNEELSNVTLFLETDDDFFPISPALQNLQTLRVNERRTVVYQVAVSGSASGKQTFRIRFGADDLSPESEEFEFSVSSSKDVLLISKSMSAPITLIPGGEGEIRITVENEGDDRVRDVLVKLELSGEIPFAPRGTSTEKRIERIGRNDAEEVSFQISVLPTAESLIYKIPVTITYRDEFGKSFTKHDIISLEVASQPRIEVTIDNQGFIEGRKNTVTLRAVNVGLGDVEFLRIKLLPGNYEALSSDQIYLGNIDSDDFQTADFDLLFSTHNPSLNIQLVYEDQNHEPFQEEISLPLKVYNEKKARELGLIKGNATAFIIFGVVVFFVLLFILRRIRKRRKS